MHVRCNSKHVSSLPECNNVWPGGGRGGLAPVDGIEASDWLSGCVIVWPGIGLAPVLEGVALEAHGEEHTAQGPDVNLFRNELA